MLTTTAFPTADAREERPPMAVRMVNEVRIFFEIEDSFGERFIDNRSCWL